MDDDAYNHMVAIAAGRLAMFNFMASALAFAISNGRSPAAQADVIAAISRDLQTHRGEHLTLGAHQLTPEEQAQANLAYREEIASLSAQLLQVLGG